MATHRLLLGRGGIPSFPRRSFHRGEENLYLLLEITGHLFDEVVGFFRTPGREIAEGILDSFTTSPVRNGVDVPSPAGVGAKLLGMLLSGGMRPSPTEPRQPLLAEGLGPGPGPRSLVLLRGGDTTIGRTIGLLIQPGAEPRNGEALAFSNSAPGGQNPCHRAYLEGGPIGPGKSANCPGDDSASRVRGVRAAARIGRVKILR